MVSVKERGVAVLRAPDAQAEGVEAPTTMTSLSPTRADDNRNAAAVNLAARHLIERAARHVTARQVAGRLVWHVESQTRPGVTYTVTRTADGWECSTCSCEDAAYRHMTCKHQRLIDLLSPAPAPAPIGITADSVAVITRRPRVEPVEEV